MCEHRLWADVPEVVCHRTDPHVPGASCRYVAEESERVTAPPERTDYPWSIAS